MFAMTSQGSAYGRFRRALDRGNTLAAMSAAAELDHVGLGDALELVRLLAADEDSARFERAALRWHARVCQQARDVTPAGDRLCSHCSRCSRALVVLRAACVLAQLCDRSEMLPIAEMLLRRAS